MVVRFRGDIDIVDDVVGVDCYCGRVVVCVSLYINEVIKLSQFVSHCSKHVVNG